MFAEAHEVLHLSREVMHGGTIFLVEFAFTSDHQLFKRVCQREDHGEGEKNEGWKTEGWLQMPSGWTDLKKLQKAVAIQTEKGWESTWHPAYLHEAQEFVKQASF